MIKRSVLILIRFYQKAISPFLYPSCRYLPSCSSYAMTAIERYGSFKGLTLSLIRVLCCNPLFNGGTDYVPEDWPGWCKIFKDRFDRLFWRK